MSSRYVIKKRIKIKLVMLCFATQLVFNPIVNSRPPSFSLSPTLSINISTKKIFIILYNLSFVRRFFKDDYKYFLQTKRPNQRRCPVTVLKMLLLTTQNNTHGCFVMNDENRLGLFYEIEAVLCFQTHSTAELSDLSSSSTALLSGLMTF